MSKVLIPGSFDPITLGHIDIIKKCSKSFDKVIVMVGYNENKKEFLSAEKRVMYALDALKDLQNVDVVSYPGFVIDFAYDNKIDFIVKGIRNNEDFEYESQMASVNYTLSLEKYGRGIETFFINSSPEYRYTSSTLVRQLMELKLPFDKYAHNPKLLNEITR
ncbi:MAG: pantetheine-phosphate adenylyltransferase [Clostridia bacterium]|nr:pantetheine-phosphate adenylyltransferase [Clostridia bacterium]